MNSLKVIVLLVFIQTSLTCGCGDPGTDFLVKMRFYGPEQAMSGRRINVEGVEGDEPVESVDGFLAVHVSVCTDSRSAFLNEELHVELVESDGTEVSSGTIKRVACKNAKKVGVEEYNEIWIDEDGEIETDMSNTETNFSNCSLPNRYSYRCAEPVF